MACIYSLVLVGLDNIQDALENPFDGLSEDDIRFDAPNALLTHSIVGVHGELCTLLVLLMLADRGMFV